MATDEVQLPTELIIGLLQLANSEDRGIQRSAKRLLELNALQLAREVVALRYRLAERESESSS